MDLVKFKVNKFRSVEDADWVNTDNWTCLVGVNEAGKTNLLLPLWKFNPVDQATKINLLLDYPRDKYFKTFANDGELKKEAFIEVLFKLNANEQENFKSLGLKSLILQNNKEDSTSIPQNNSFVEQKNFATENTHTEDDLDLTLPEDDTIEQSDIFPTLNTDIDLSLEEENAVNSLFDNEEESVEEEIVVSAPLVADNKENLVQYLLIKKDFNEKFYVFASNINADEIEEYSAEQNEALFNAIIEAMPKFVYYSEYGNLDSDIYLPKILEDLEKYDTLSEKEKLKARTLKVLFSHLGLDPKSILSLGQEITPTADNQQSFYEASSMKQERFAQIEAAATILSNEFKEWWSEGKYSFRFNADGHFFRILVSDNERTTPIELESRSKGLQWFFSFFLVFFIEGQNAHNNCILLLDEPGLHLHPNAQKDLLRFFNNLAEKNQFIYTTSLPYLLDQNHLDRIKAVYTENGITKISNDLNNADKEKKAVIPVTASLTIAISQALLAGATIIIVQDVTAQNYLSFIKALLISKGRFKPLKELLFMPVSSPSAAIPIVQLIQGNEAEIPLVLVDSDDASAYYHEYLMNHEYKSNKKKALLTDKYIDKKSSTIEDFFPPNLIIEAFNRISKSDIEIEIEEIRVDFPLVAQLEIFAKKHKISLDRDWRVQLSKKVIERFKESRDRKYEEMWYNVFYDLTDTTRDR